MRGFLGRVGAGLGRVLATFGLGAASKPQHGPFAEVCAHADAEPLVGATATVAALVGATITVGPLVGATATQETC